MSEPVSESSLHILRIYANAAGGIFPARRGILREIPYGKGVYRLATAFFRTIILYLLLIAGLRLSGKRQIGELEPIELVLTLLISDLASVPMQDFGLPLLNGVVPILALIALSTLFSCASLRNVRFRSLVCGEPALVIRDGRIRQEVMHHNRLTLDELMEELRGQGVLDINTVKYAVLETSGHLSVLLRADRQPLTAQQMAAAVEDDVLLPTVVINDGRVMAENLRQAGRDENWLRQQIAEAENKASPGRVPPVRGRGRQRGMPAEGGRTMKAIRIPVFVLAVLLAFSVCNAVHLTRRCALWQAELAEADRAAAMGDTEAAGAALARLEALWQADQAYLHIVVSHEDIHDAEALLQRAALLCGIGNDELRPALAELRAAMSMVAETQQISAKNIL